MNLYLAISAIFLITLLLGHLVEKIRVPWLFAALIAGTALSFSNPFSEFTGSATFDFMAQLGMYFLLFLVGLEINIKDIQKHESFIVRSAVIIIILEALVGSVTIHYLFSYDWMVSILVALSFATVGEAMLIPILDEFKIINTPLGQSIIGIGTVDDIIEIITLVLASILVGTEAGENIVLILTSLIVLFLLTVGLTKLKKKNHTFRFIGIESLFLFLLFIFFLFVGIGTLSDVAPLAAMLAGISLNLFLPKERLKIMEKEIKAITYGFFAPLFFLKVGAELDLGYLVAFPLLMLTIIVVSNGTKIFGSWILARKELGTKGSILLGIGLSVRFSTSIIVLQFLLNHGIIGEDIFSVTVASSIMFMFIVPLLFSQLLIRWKIAKPIKSGAR